MALVFIDLVQEVALTPPLTGAFIGSGATATGFFPTSKVGDGNTYYYGLTDFNGNVELGLGTYTAATNQTARSPIISTNNNALVDFTTLPTIYSDIPAVVVQSLINAATGKLLTSAANALPTWTTLGSGVLTALGNTAGGAGGFALQSSFSSAPTILGQSGLPLIMLAKGSFANNGVYTPTTAFVTTYASGYAYVTAGGIASGIPAADTILYFTGQSASQLTFFNNAYTSGTPAIPASPTAFVTTGAGAYTGSISSKTLYSLSIPGNLLGANGAIRIWLTMAYTTSAASKTFTVQYGGTTFANIGMTTTTTNAGPWGFRNRGITNSQVGMFSPIMTPVGAGSTALDYGTIDSTQAQNLTVILTNSTPATNNMVLEQVTVELLPSVA